MQTYKDLFINIDDDHISDYMMVVGSSCNKWGRQPDREMEYVDIGETVFCFRREKDDSLPGAEFVVFKKEKALWHIPNVVPIEAGYLTYDDYNNLLTEFFDGCLKPNQHKYEMKLTLTSGEISDEDIVGSNAATKLHAFSSSANKSTGSSHPRDRERWLSFIVEAYKSGKEIDAEDLERLLQEQGWSEQSSLKLAIEFEFALDLLNYLNN